MFGIRTVGNHLALLYVLAFVDNRLLINACARIRAHEFPFSLRHMPVLGNDNLIRSNRSDFAAIG